MEIGDEVKITNPRECTFGCVDSMEELKNKTATITNKIIEGNGIIYKLSGNSFNWCHHSISLIRKATDKPIDQPVNESIDNKNPKPPIIVVWKEYPEQLQDCITEKYADGYILSNKPIAGSKGFAVLMELTTQQKQLQ